MIITQTPFRMSFFGGGTDMESFFRENGGAVLSTTFDKYCYVNVRHLPRFFDYSTELSYSKTERVTCIEDIQHPAIRNAMKMLDMHEIRLTYEADLPARSGLGTSSSFAVGMLNAFYALKGKYADKKKLADEAIYLERNLCQEAGGWQDQIAASFGGFNRINFNADGYEVLPVIIAPERKKQLNKNLMMFFTGFTRFSSDVQKANAAGKVDKTAQLKEMLALVDEAEKVLVNKEQDLDDFGRMLDHAGLHVINKYIEKEALYAMMAVLTEKQRNLIYQNYVLDKTHQEIADGMEIARGSVTRSVNQALERIRRKFDFEAHYELAVGDFT